MNASRTLALTLLGFVMAGGLRAQKREDFIALQRDVAQLQDQMKQLQKSQDEKMAALTGLVQQALDQSAKLSTSLGQMQTSLTTTLNEQQSKVVAPVAALGAKVDQMGDEFRGIRDNVSDLSTQLGRLDTKLADISSAVRTLSAPPVAPPSAPGAAASATIPFLQLASPPSLSSRTPAAIIPPSAMNWP